jgi:hypothetical protein
MAIDRAREKAPGIGPAWAEGFTVAALSGWATLTQPLPVALPAALLWVGCVLRSRRTAVRGGLLIGLGGSWLSLTAAAGWQTLPWVWVVLSVALLVAGVAVSRVAVRTPNRADSRIPAIPHSRAIVLATVVASLLVVGIGLPLRPSEYALPTNGALPWLTMCGGVGLDAVVRGNPSDPRVAWLENRGGGNEEATWPAGYRARFTPKLEILDGWGNVVLREGDHVSGSCGGVTDSGAINMIPPFNQ